MTTPRYPDRALILGGGSRVWDEVIEVEDLLGRPWEGWVVAANDAGVHWPRELHHWVSLHPRKFPEWEEQRAGFGFTPCPRTWAVNTRFTTDRIIPWPGGSSGMLAVQVAMLAMGAGGRGILCGVPMTPTPHFHESTEEHFLDADGNWAHADKHWNAWLRETERLRPCIRSMSGRTRELLGEPTREWLMGDGVLHSTDGVVANG